MDMALDLIEKKRKFSTGNRFGRHCIIFGVDMSSSVPVDNKKREVKMIEGLDGTALLAETKRSINFTGNNKKFCLNLHYNDGNSYLLVNNREITKFKERDSEILATRLCVGNIWKNFSADNMKKTGLNGYIYDFSIDYDAIAVDDILDIHKYLIKKILKYKTVEFIKKCLL